MFLLHSLALCFLFGVGLSWKQPICSLTKGIGTEPLSEEIRELRKSMSALTTTLQQLGK